MDLLEEARGLLDLGMPKVELSAPTPTTEKHAEGPVGEPRLVWTLMR
jgi:hypothetical protein